MSIEYKGDGHYHYFHENPSSIIRRIGSRFSKKDFNIFVAKIANENKNPELYQQYLDESLCFVVNETKTDNTLTNIEFLLEKKANLYANDYKIFKQLIDSDKLEMFQYLFSEKTPDLSIQEDLIKKVGFQNTLTFLEQKFPEITLEITPWLKSVQFQVKRLYQKQISLNNELISSCSKNNIENIEKIIKNGADVTYLNNLVLYNASMNGDLDLVKLLIDNGADIYTKNNIIIENIAELNHLHIVEYLVKEKNVPTSSFLTNNSHALIRKWVKLYNEENNIQEPKKNNVQKTKINKKIKI